MERSISKYVDNPANLISEVVGQRGINKIASIFFISKLLREKNSIVSRKKS